MQGDEVGVLSDRLRDLVDAEAAVKAGRVSRDPSLASMSMTRLQREMRETAEALAKALDEDIADGDALVDALREEARLAQSPEKPKSHVVTTRAGITGDLHRQAMGAWFATGLLFLGALLSVFNTEWVVAGALGVGALLCLLRSRLGIRQLRVDGSSGRILLRVRARWEPIDFAQYSDARGIHTGWPVRVASVIVVQRRPVCRYTTGTLYRLLPQRSRNRLVFIINSCWRTADGHLIAAHAMDDLIENGCKSAGFRVEHVESGRAGLPGWVGKRR